MKAQRWRQMMHEEDDTGSLRPKRQIETRAEDRPEQR